MNIMDDQFFQKVAEDLEVCEELLQVILDKPDLKIIENQTQRFLRNTGARSVILDVLCQDSTGSLFNIEVQKSNRKKQDLQAEEYQKRVRFHLANIDTVFAEKGIDYHTLPDIYAVFISEDDPFQQNCTTYHVQRLLRETGSTVENGLHEIYVNTAVNDESDIAELMQYFTNSSGYHPKFQKLSKRVQYFKEEQKGVMTVANVFEEYAEEKVKEAVGNLLQKGVAPEIIAEAIPSLSSEVIQQLKEQLDMTVAG